jgi:large subunit ribosomal protein L19e
MVDLKLQKRLASEIMDVGIGRVYIDPERLEDVKQAITRQDIRSLIRDGAIKKRLVKGSSKGRIRKRLAQRRKGRQKGPGHRKGTENARFPKKKRWMGKVRAQRKFLKLMREKQMLSSSEYRKLYLRVKGGFFRSVAHLKLHTKKKEN